MKSMLGQVDSLLPGRVALSSVKGVIRSDGSRYEKRGKREPVCVDDEIPFDVPEGWEWARVGSLCFIGTGATPHKANKKYYENGTVPWITSASARKASINSPDGYITEVALKETNCKVYPPGSLVIAMYGEGRTRGSISELNISAATNQACAVLLEFENGCLQDYIRICYERSYEALRGKAKGGVQPNLNLGIISALLVPVPPLAEQLRIVAELDRLLALVDGVERDSADLDALRARARSKVLDLAVRGLLAPQGASDEPAGELLARAAEERARLVREGRARAPKGGLSVIERRSDGRHYEKRGSGDPVPVEVPYDLPEGWAWARLGSIVYLRPQVRPGATFSYVAIGSIDNKLHRLSRTDTIIEAADAPSRARKPVARGDILYSTVRPYLHNMCIVDRDFSAPPIASTGFAAMVCHSCIFNRYLFQFLMSPSFDSYANASGNSTGSSYPAISDDALYRALVPVPPLPEQVRIAEMVDTAFELLN